MTSSYLMERGQRKILVKWVPKLVYFSTLFGWKWEKWAHIIRQFKYIIESTNSIFIVVRSFLCSWHNFWKNAFYLYLSSFKWIQEYISWSMLKDFTSGSIEDMKSAQRNKSEKVEYCNLNTWHDTSCYWE